MQNFFWHRQGRALMKEIGWYRVAQSGAYGVIVCHSIVLYAHYNQIRSILQNSDTF